MKKQLLGKVLTAFFILAISAFSFNLNGQVKITFANDSAEIGHSTTGSIAPLTLNFKINSEGQISLDASSGNPDSLVMAVVDRWDSDSVGTTDVASLFGYNFALVATSGTDRLQCGYSATGAQGGLGIQGKNQRRIDDKGTETMNFVLKGEVGLEFTSVAYSDVNTGIGNIANLRFIDYDSDETYFIDKPVLTGDSSFILPAGVIKMRNSLDTLRVTTSDTIATSDGNEGSRLFGLEFNVVEQEAKALPAGQIALNFKNETGVRVGNDATGSLAPLSLAFTIDAAGKISMDATTGNENASVVAVVDSWDSDSLGSTDNATLFDKTFALSVSSSGRIQCDSDGGMGGLGVQGRNQWRIDDLGKEKLYFILSGDVGLEFVSAKYNSLSSGANDMGHLRFIDYNSDIPYIVKQPAFTPFSEYSFPEAEVQMRYKTDTVTVTTSDTIGNGDEGARLYGIVLNVVEPIIKPPAIDFASPAPGDTAVDISTDFVILFDTPVDQATSSAITFSPDVANRTESWNGAGNEITISFDDLSYFTEYVVTVGTDLKGTNGLNILNETVLTFRTKPAPPTVVYAYPEDQSKDIPANTPLTVEFSQAMDVASVESAISFDPALSVESFAWNRANTKAYILVDEMESGQTYTATVGTDAADKYGSQLDEAFEFTFTIVRAVSVDNKTLADVVLYPNPASEILQVRGMEVASLKIYSITGRLVKETFNSAVVNVSDIEPGSYVVTVSDRDDNKLRKLIIIE